MAYNDKLIYRYNLVDFANRIGYLVELESTMKGQEKKDDDGNIILNEDGKTITPAGDCNYLKRRIRVREGKKIDGQIATLIHELSHALGLGGPNYFSWLGEAYVELAAESVTEIVTRAIGIDRTKQTSSRIYHGGFNGYLISPVTIAISKILLREIKGESNA